MRKNFQPLIPVLFCVFLLVGCGVGSHRGPYRQVHPTPPSQIRPKIERIAKLYLDPTATQKDLLKAYLETYKAIQTSTYKKQIEEEIIRPMRENIDIMWLGKGLLTPRDFMKGKKFSRSNPALVLVTPFPLVSRYESFTYFTDIEFLSDFSYTVFLDDFLTLNNFINIVFLNTYKNLLKVNYVGLATHLFLLKDWAEYPTRYVESLKKTLKNSDVDKRNICFLIRRYVKTGEEQARQEYQEKSGRELQKLYEKGEVTEFFYKRKMKEIGKTKKVEYINEWCTVQCSEEVNLLYNFRSPCWGKEVFEYLRKNVYRSF